MEKEEYKIEIETTGDYKNKKEFNKVAMLTEREFTALVNHTLNFLDDPEAQK